MSENKPTEVLCRCFLQEGQISEAIVKALAIGIRKLVSDHGLGDKLNESWIVVPEGCGWSAGEPSRCSVVSLVTPEIDQTKRVAILTALCDLWMDKTGCAADEVLATVMPYA